MELKDSVSDDAALESDDPAEDDDEDEEHGELDIADE